MDHGMPEAWAQLIEALTLLASHQVSDISPLHCEGDELSAELHLEQLTGVKL